MLKRPFSQVFPLLIPFYIFMGSYTHLLGQKVKSGPMVGYSQMREVLVWVQLDQQAEVQLQYWPHGEKKESAHISQKVNTSAGTAFVAKLLADSVQPGIQYSYEIVINGKPQSFDYETTFESQTLWQHRTDPPNFRLALGSCTYINEKKYDRPKKPYGGDYGIFESIYEDSANLMLWLGDNIYLREPDWFTKTGIYHRYTDFRSLPELQPLWANTHHYAIWDDHDFGPNNADRSFPFKHLTKEAFELFWGNPEVAQDFGINSFFQWNDMDFFLLDNRWNRSPNNRVTGDRQLLGKDQIEWLIDLLKYSRAPFKFVAVGGQVVSDAAKYENHAIFPEEREYLLNRIAAEKIKGVVFLTGDRHHTELSSTTINNVLIYDLTISPLTSGSAGDRALDEGNTNRVEGTYVGDRNYGIIDFSGSYRNREMHIQVKNSDGKLLWDKTIEQPE